MYDETIEQLNQATKAQELERNLLHDFVRQAKKEQQALDDIRREKTQLLTRIRNKKRIV